MARSTPWMKLNAPLRLVSMHEVPVFLAHAHGEAVAGEPGVVDEDIDPLEIGEDALADGDDFLVVGHIDGVGASAAPGHGWR